ncbi:MAG: PKD domain-containing protein [Lysobacterales bacterium]|jgi:uncharacterized protein YkwD
MKYFLLKAGVTLLALCSQAALAEVHFAIGEPAEGSVKSGIGQVSGWAVSDRKITSIEALIDGVSLGPVPYGGSRMDVAAAFPDFPDSEHSGWSMKWNFSLHDPGDHLLTVIVTEDDGTQWTKEVQFSTVAFHSQFIADPGAVLTAGAAVSSPEDGRLVVQGAEIEGQAVDVELAWDKTAQQFIIDRIVYPDQPQQNLAPTAYAGANVEVESGAEVNLVGDGTDQDGYIVSQEWTQVSGPSVSLSPTGAWSVRFTAPQESGDIRMRLTVTDNEGLSDTDDVIVKVLVPADQSNQAPTAYAGPDRTVQQGDSVSITGDATDPDGNIVSWSWSQVSGPTVSLSGAGSQQVQFTAPDQAGDIRLRLTVTDDDGAADSDDTIVTVEAPAPPPNASPTAFAGPDFSVQQGEAVSITGDGSDSDGAIATWSWSQVSGPTVSLSGAGSQQIQFTAPDQAGDIRLRLTVTDDDGAADSDDVVVTVEEASAPDNTTGGTLSSMLTVINEARGQARTCGETEYPAQPPLSWSSSLADIAMQHSMEMAHAGYFAHVSADGTSMGTRVFPYWSGSIVGENIATSSADRTDAYVVDLWLNSAGHCALIMDPRFTHAGIGWGHDPDNGWVEPTSGILMKYFWTLDFGG